MICTITYLAGGLVLTVSLWCCTVVCRYGPLNRVEIKRNYAFVEFKNLQDAIDAQKRSHGTAMDGRTITVEFVESSRLGRDRWAQRDCMVL
jgi:hypothetical protein